MQAWFRGRKELIEQAGNQLRAAKGTPIDWHIAEKEFVPVLHELFRKEGISGIKLIHTPAK